ncbi:MAG: hypothetical protein HYR88_14370 [Verrucomicrobia bacterium]|nr:hypothetical protein [Verrucomicrobiota bacterium]
MSKRPWSRSRPDTDATPPPELERILCDLKAPDAQTRANAVRELCPCRGSQWGAPIFQTVFAMRNDPSPLVQRAVLHDLEENRWWGERQEARRLEGHRVKREIERLKAESEAEPPEAAAPSAHSLAWRTPRRPRRRKGYYPRPGER